MFPELPSGAGKPRGGWKVSSLEDQNRRSIYVFVHSVARSSDSQRAFDMPDTHESCGRRNQTITAPQAMSLLNSKVSLDWAEAFASRILKQAGTDQNAQIENAYRLAYDRKPDGFEKRLRPDISRHTKEADLRARSGRRETGSSSVHSGRL